MAKPFQHLTFLLSFILLSFTTKVNAEPIFHEKHYPSGKGPFPVVIALHTSFGYKSVRKAIKGFEKSGYAVYTPDFFKRYGIGPKNRFETWTKYRLAIEKELIEIIEVAKSDTNIDPKNVFSVGYSNGGYWASFLAAKKYVNAGASQYGVWSWPRTHNGYPAKYFSQDSNPLLALHGGKDTVQQLKWAEPQIKKAANKSSNFKYHLFSEAGHSWDCKPCKHDGYKAEFTQQALEMTLNFFRENTKK
jgi:dienelactone hydrolase